MFANKSKTKVVYRVDGAERTDLEQMINRLTGLQREIIGMSAVLRSVIDGIALRERLNNADVIFDMEKFAFIPKPKPEAPSGR